MQYYLERKGLLPKDFKINYYQLRDYFIETYYFFNRKGDFISAFQGIHQGDRQIAPPTMMPCPDIYFIKHFQNTKIYPIEEYYEKYEPDTLFAVIEALHNHIARYDKECLKYEVEEARKEFREHINSLLRLYDKGYFIDNRGYILELPNDALIELISSEPEEIEPENIIDKYRAAIKMYLHYSSSLEEKRKAINLLADILEPLRAELKDILNEEWDFNKNAHDNLIFQIVNTFNVRHNKEVKNYSEEIWFEWMFHYYISVINTYYRLLKAKRNEE